MSIEPHLLDDEEVLAYCTTDYWAWICTDRRVLKYRKGRGTVEQLHDLSFDEISAISLVNTGRNDKLGGYGVFAIVSGLVITPVALRVAFFSLVWATIIGIGLFVIGAYLIYRWMNSEESYFEFRGSGLIQMESEEWRIDETAADNPDEIREYVRTVRSQL